MGVPTAYATPHHSQQSVLLSSELEASEIGDCTDHHGCFLVSADFVFACPDVEAMSADPT